MLKRTLLASLAIVVLATPSRSEPDDVTRHLMEDSPSMLDFGIFRLERFLNKSGEDQLSRVRYDWDRNVIEVSNRFFDGHMISEAEALQKCTSYFDTMRELAGVDTETGRLQSWKESSEFAWHFLHIGSVQEEHAEHDPKIQTLDQKFQIRFVVADVVNADGANFSLVCDGKLLSSDFDVQH